MLPAFVDCSVGMFLNACVVDNVCTACRCREARERCDVRDGSCASGCARGWGGTACHIGITRTVRGALFFINN